jgi:hypothetical protein
MKDQVPRLLALTLGAGVIAAGGYYYLKNQEPDLTLSPKAVSSPISQLPVTAPRYPLPRESDLPESPPGGDGLPATIPRLDDSDPTLEIALKALFSGVNLSKLLVTQDFVRRFVVTTLNSVGRTQPLASLSPVIPPSPGFLVKEDETISDENFKRYTPYVELIARLDAHQAVKFYIKAYKIFQAAYDDLGAPGHFNDHLIDTLESALQAPMPPGPIRVSRTGPTHAYKFVDAELEALTPIQKILVRMGPAHTQVIQEKLKKIRGLLLLKKPR